MTEYNLFNPAPVRSTDPQTSVEAAQRIGEFAEKHRQMIAKALEKGPMGKDGIARITGLTGEQVCRRLSEMYKKYNTVEPTGRNVKSDSGYNEREWRLNKAL